MGVGESCTVVAKAPQKKQEVISQMVEARQKVIDAASSLAPWQQDQVFLGEWTVNDLLAHLVGWDYANLEAVQAILDDRLPGFYQHHDHDWRSFNRRLVREHRVESFADLLVSLQQSHHQLIDRVRAVPAEEFFKDRGLRFKGYKVMIGRILLADAKDGLEHAEQIVQFRDRGQAQLGANGTNSS
jgi:hypothetical protein